MRSATKHVHRNETPGKPDSIGMEKTTCVEEPMGGVRGSGRTECLYHGERGSFRLQESLLKVAVERERVYVIEKFGGRGRDGT